MSEQTKSGIQTSNDPGVLRGEIPRISQGFPVPHGTNLLATEFECGIPPEIPDCRTHRSSLITHHSLNCTPVLPFWLILKL